MMGRLGARLRRYAERDGRGYPDWATRYLPIVRRLQSRLSVETLVIEIGANANGLARFMDGRVVAVDLNPDHLREARAIAPDRVFPVVADVTALPFADASQQLIVSVDLIEHLPDILREKALQEMARIVNREGTGVVAFPSGAAAARAEHVIAEEYAFRTFRMLTWLVQHAALGLPDGEMLGQALENRVAATHRVVRISNTSLVVWRWMWRVLLCGWPGRGNALFQALLRFATPVLARIHWGTCYRCILWMEPKSE